MKKTIALALAGALAAGTALVGTAANAQSGFSVSVGSPGYYDDHGWGSGWATAIDRSIPGAAARSWGLRRTAITTPRR
jgi:hypothetical protein